MKEMRGINSDKKPLDGNFILKIKNPNGVSSGTKRRSRKFFRRFDFVKRRFAKAEWLSAGLSRTFAEVGK